MVTKSKTLLFTALTAMISSVAFSQTAPKKIRLSQKDVAELVLKQGSKTKETNLEYLQNRLAAAEVLTKYDWKLAVNAGYLFDKTHTFSPNMPDTSKHEKHPTDITLTKPIALTGTILGIEIHRLSQRADVAAPTPPATAAPAQQTQDNYGITIEQPLLGNFLGLADRAAVNAAETTYQATEILRANALEDVVLDTIRLFWDTYVAQDNFKESVASRDRTKKLLDSVKRKTSLGYSAPGDLSQTQAQYEIREQNVKSASVTYLKNMDNLLTSLGLEPGSEIEFAVTESVPPVPKLSPVKTDDLRVIRSQRLKLTAAEESLAASKSSGYPNLAFVGKVYTTGTDETSDGSYSEAASGKHPQYYAGLKLEYNFGSDIQTERIINKKAMKELEESRLARQLLESSDGLVQAERRVQSTYAIAQSAVKQREYLDKAVQELNRTYAQGRTDIKTLIDVMNNYFTAEVSLSRAIGDYQIALNELAASRDELISESKENK